MRLLALLLLLYVVAASESEGAVDPRATAELAPELSRLMREQPVRFSVRVIVVGKRVVAWLQTLPLPENTILILDRGRRENIRRLRHEWTHARQRSERRAFDEAEARRAER